MENKMTTTITRGDSLALINDSIRNISNELPVQDSDIQKIIFAVNNDLQIRDYLIGLPNSYTLEQCSEFVDYLARMAGDESRYAFDTVNAMYNYELENTKACERLITQSYKANPDYSLTKLVSRVLEAGWPSNAFANMRNELAPKVMDNILEDIDFVIEEDN
jgi:sulfur transfer complex TusBCD TusB component (DsrH family)